MTPLYFGASSRITCAGTITLPIGWAITTPAWRADYSPNRPVGLWAYYPLYLAGQPIKIYENKYLSASFIIELIKNNPSRTFPLVVLFRKIRLKPDDGVVIIKGQPFKMIIHKWYEEGERSYELRDPEGEVLKLIRDVKFREIPKKLTISCDYVARKIKFNDGPRMYFTINRDSFRCSICFEKYNSLLEQSEYFTRLSRMLEDLRYDVKQVKHNGKWLEVQIAPMQDYRIGDLAAEIVRTIYEVNEWAIEEERELQNYALRLRDELTTISGEHVVRQLNLKGVAKWIIGALNSTDITYILLGARLLRAPNTIVERVFKELVPDSKPTIQKLKCLGVIYEENGLRFSKIGGNLSDMLRQAYGEVSRKPYQRELPVTRYFAPAALLYISRNLLSFAINKSKTLKSKRKKAGFFQFINEQLFKKLNFVHLSVIMGISLGQLPPIDLIEREIEQLIDLGVISTNLKLKPYGRWIAALLKGFSRKVVSQSSGPLSTDQLKIIWSWESLSKTTYTPAQCAEELKKRKGWWLYPAGRI